MSHSPHSGSTPASAQQSPGAGPSRARWREYPIGFVGESLYTLTGIIVAVLVGVGLSAAIIFAMGLLNEEAGLGAIGASVDQFARAGFIVGASIAAAGALGYSIAMGLKELVVSRAVVRAARGGADRSAVPTPQQVGLIVAPGFRQFVGVAGWILIVGGVIGLIGVYALIVDHDELPVLPILAILVPLVLLGVAIVLALKKLRPEQSARRAEVAAHWTTGHEGNVWGAVRRSTAAGEPAGSRYSGAQPRIRLGAALTYTAAALGLVAGLGVFLGLVIAYPDARVEPVVELGERGELTPAAEDFVELVFLIVAVLATLAVLLVAAGAIIEGGARTRERRRLQAALNDPAAPRPDSAVLQRHSQREPVRLAQVLAALAGAGLVASLTVILLASGELEDFADVYRGAAPVFSDLTGPALIILAVSVLLVVAAVAWNGWAHTSGTPLRGELIARWPVLPDPKKDADDAAAQAWRRGPVLTAKSRD